MRGSLQIVLVFLGIVIAFSLLGACAAGTNEEKASGPVPKTDGNYTVKIGFPSSARDMRAPDGPDIWGMENGFFDEEFKADGIKVEYVPFLGAAPAINEALAAGSLEMAYIADIGALIGKAAGLKTSLVGMGNPDGATWWLIVSPSSSAQKVADLKGKKVATVKATLPHFYLLKALERNGLQATDIELINMTLPDSEQALRSDQIDATVTGGWTGVRVLSQGIRAVDSTKETPIGRGTIAFVATDSFIAAHPSFFPRYFKARQQATDWANANRDEAFALLVKNFGGVERSLLEPLYTDPFNFDQSLSADVLARIKALTGQDTITARFLHAEFFSFEPVAKYFFAVNDKPIVEDGSFGFWRRIRLIPFERQFTGCEIDRKLDNTLACEASGILNWLIQGCLNWQVRGLEDTPATIEAATTQYKCDNDDLAAFLAAMCIEHPKARITASRFYKALKQWCVEQGYQDKEIMTYQKFGRLMGKKFQKIHKEGGTTYLGVSLKTDGLADGFDLGITQNNVSHNIESYTRENIKQSVNPSVYAQISVSQPQKDNTGPGELPDCPDCGRNEWEYTPAGNLLCPCGYKQGTSQ